MHFAFALVRIKVTTKTASAKQIQVDECSCPLPDEPGQNKKTQKKSCQVCNIPLKYMN